MHTLKDFGVTKHVGKLKNGVRVVLFERPNVPVSTLALFKAGSRLDPKGKEGLAHFAEHMMFKKTEKFESENDISRYIERLGGKINAFTWVDMLGVSVDVASAKDFKDSAVFVSELIQNSRFTKEQVDKERGVILREIDDYKSNPAMYIYTLMYSALFQDTDVGKPVAGTNKSVKNITYKDIKDFYDNLIDPNDMTIVISGGIEIDEVISTYNKILSLSEKDTPIFIRKEPLKILRESSIKIEKYIGSEQVHFTVGFRTPPIYSDDQDVLSVIEAILGSGLSSSLFRRLRTENGLVYSIAIVNENLSDASHFNTFTATSKESLNKTLDIVISEYKRMCSDNIFEGELQLAKDKLIKSKIRELQTSALWSNFHYLDELLCPDRATDVADWMNKIEKVTVEDVKRVATKYFKPGSWYLALCGDIEEKDFKVNY